MTLRQLPRLTSLLNSKPPRSITALQILEAIDWNPRSTGRKLQQPGLLFSIPTPNTFPEILDDFVVFSVSAVVSVLLPVINVDICNSTDQELEFTFVEDIYEVHRDKLVEACDEGVKLFFHTLLDAPFGYETEILLAYFARI